MKSPNCQSRQTTSSSLHRPFHATLLGLHRLVRILCLITLLLNKRCQARLLYLVDSNNQSSLVSDEHLPADDAVYIGPTHVVEEQSVTIRCVLSIFQSPAWSLNGQLLQLDRLLLLIESDTNRPLAKYSRHSQLDRERNSRSEFLTIRKANFVDSGHYRCSLFGSRSHSLQVLVHDWSRFRRQTLPTLNYQLRYPGELVILFCDLGRGGQHRPVDSRVKKKEEDDEEEEKGRGRDSNTVVLHKDENGVETIDSSDPILSSPTTSSTSTADPLSDSSFDQLLQWSHWSKTVHEWNGQARVLANRSGVFVCRQNDRRQLFYVFEPASIHNFRRKQHAKPTLTMELECEPHGFPRPQIQWFSGNSKVDPSQERFGNVELVPNASGYSNAVLRIRNASSEDSSTYTCKAQNQVDRERFEAEDSIQVFISEKVIQANPVTALSLFRISEVHCRILSEDETIDHWIFNDTRIEPDVNKYRLANRNQSLIILKSSFNDEGVYRCVASNGQFHDQLLVAVPKLKFVESPNVKMNYLSAYVIVGQDVRILCSAYSQVAQNDFAWNYENLPVNQSNILPQPNGLQLVIRNLSRSHAGQYMCNVTNEVGSEQKVLHLRIYDPYNCVWPFAGIATLVVILFSCIVCCPEKKKRRPHSD